MVNICNPLLFFIVLVSVWLVVILFTTPNKVMRNQMILQTIIWGIILGIFIYYFCSIGKISWAWFVVFLPLLVSVVIIALFIMGFSIGVGMEVGKQSQDIMNYFYKK